MNKPDNMDKPNSLNKFDWFVLAVGIILLITMFISLRGCKQKRNQLEFYIMNTYENTHLLEKYVNEVEKYVPEDVYNQLLVRYEEAKSASSDLLKEYLKIENKR